MAELQPPPPPPPPPPSTTPQYWCYQCDKRVPIETLPNLPDHIICFECKNGFVEYISPPQSPPPPTTADEQQQQQQQEEEDEEDSPSTFGNEFLQVLRLIAQAARDDDDDEQPPPPPPPPSDGHRRTGDTDYLRIELDGWQNDNEIEIENGNVNLNEDEDEEDEFDEDPFQSDPGRNRNRFVIDDNDDEDEEEEEEVEIRNRNLEVGEIEGENEGEIEIEGEEEDFVRRDRRDVLRLRLRDFASRAASRRNRILDWAEILMGLEDQSIEFRLQLNGDDDNNDGNYVGNPGDYVDAAGYEALLQNLAENDGGGGRRGAPPAAKSAVEGLQTVNVKSTDVVIMEICAICKEMVFGNEDKNDDNVNKVVKKLECGHMYHGDCIVPWLGSRNTCPVCRYELPTDDAEYEEDRKKKRLMVIMDGSGTGTGTGTDHGCSSSSGGGVGGGGGGGD